MNREWTSVRGPSSTVSVVQLTPSAPVQFGEERLLAARNHSILGDTDRDILAAASSVPAEHGDFVVVLNARAGDTSLWSIDPALDDAQAARIASSIVRGQLPLFRALLARRAIAFFVVGLTIRDAAVLREASARLAMELAPGDGAGLVVGSDPWLVAHYTLFTSGHLEETLTNVLPQMANVLTRRGERARRQSREITSWVPPKVG